MRKIGLVFKKGNAAVKGIQMEGLRTVGLLNEVVRRVAAQGPDEITIIDPTKSLYETKITVDEHLPIENIPVFYGGGIRTVQDAELLFLKGFDGIVLNSVLSRDFSILRKCVDRFGSSSVTVGIDYVAYKDAPMVLFDGGREPSGVSVFDWVKQIEDQGAGQVNLFDVACDGKSAEIDFHLLDRIRMESQTQLVIGGGINTEEKISLLEKSGCVDGVLLSSWFVYPQLLGITESEVSQIEGNTAFLRSQVLAR